MIKQTSEEQVDASELHIDRNLMVATRQAMDREEVEKVRYDTVSIRVGSWRVCTKRRDAFENGRKFHDPRLQKY